MQNKKYIYLIYNLYITYILKQKVLLNHGSLALQTKDSRIFDI